MFDSALATGPASAPGRKRAPRHGKRYSPSPASSSRVKISSHSDNLATKNLAVTLCELVRFMSVVARFDDLRIGPAGAPARPELEQAAAGARQSGRFGP